MTKGTSGFCRHYHHAIELIGKRWVGVILRELLGGATRFHELAMAIPELSDKMLSERLKELEAEGLVHRAVLPETPVRIEYRLTDKGKALEGPLVSVSDWAERWLAQEPAAAKSTEGEATTEPVPK